MTMPATYPRSRHQFVARQCAQTTVLLAQRLFAMSAEGEWSVDRTRCTPDSGIGPNSKLAVKERRTRPVERRARFSHFQSS